MTPTPGRPGPFPPHTPTPLQRLWRPVLWALLGGGALAATGVGVSATVKPLAFTPRPKVQAPPPAPSTALGGSPAGQPLAGLNPAGTAAFLAGLAEFQAAETPEGGLGPLFNDRSCVACHSAGGVGGGSDRAVTRFGRLTAGKFDALESLGGSLLQARALRPELLETVPLVANVVARRITTPLFGAGLIEAIADADILLNAQRPQPDGVKGRAALVTDPVTGQTRVGRFGWKAQHATLTAFAADAYLNEMGITNRFFPLDNAPNGRLDLLKRYQPDARIEDPVNPNTGRSDLDVAADFMRLLAAPAPARAGASALAGAQVFAQVRCTACHTPSLNTASSPFEPLSHKTVPLFSDLLLHDMGPLGDGIAQGAASGREMRTAPLWGLRHRKALLHDGRATGPAQAIGMHSGEARASVERYNALKPSERQQLLDFLGTL